MTLPKTTDVLIVGAGPTGLMLANQLARRRVRVVIIDRNAGPSVATKALGVQARTLEIYSGLGIAQRAVELGNRGSGANIWANGRRAARVPVGDIGRDLSPFPFLLILGQDDNERLLGEVLRARDVEVHWSTELVALIQSESSVRATLGLSDGSRVEIDAAWVGGCDGAHSAVRRLNAIEFPGAPYEHVFFLADTRVTGPMVPDELNVYLWRSGFQLFFPMRGADHWRVVGIVPPELRDREDLDLDAVLPSLCTQVGSSLVFEACTWFSTYRIHHRRAERFRAHRCFLLGDAAHIHSPVGAQGMNTGLQDAYNLAWKLALVVSGCASADLLDTYEIERIPVAERLLRTTDRAFALVVSDSRLLGWLRTRVLPKLLAIAMTRDRMRTLAFRTISQIGIRYPTSPLSRMLPGLSRRGPRAGDRFPWLRLRFAPGGAIEDLFDRLDDTRFNIVVIGQSAKPVDVDQLDGLVVTHSVADDPHNVRELARARIPTPSFYLLRPDGHIGLAGTRLEPAALERWAVECAQMSGGND